MPSQRRAGAAKGGANPPRRARARGGRRTGSGNTEGERRSVAPPHLHRIGERPEEVRDHAAGGRPEEWRGRADLPASPWPRSVSGRRPSMGRSATPAMASPEGTATASREAAARPLHECAGIPSSRAWPTNSRARVVNPRAATRRPRSTDPLERGAAQGEHGQGGEGQRLQEHVEVGGGAGKPAQREQGTRREGGHAPRAEISKKRISAQGGNGELKGEEKREGNGPGPDRLQEIEHVEIGHREGSLEEVGVPDWPAPCRSSSAAKWRTG